MSAGSHKDAQHNFSSSEQKHQPTPERFVLLLVPASSQLAELISQCGCNPQLELTFKRSKSIGAVVSHLHDKWSHRLSASLVARGLRVTNPILFRVVHVNACRGWGREDRQVPVSDAFKAVGSPDPFRLTYM